MIAHARPIAVVAVAALALGGCSQHQLDSSSQSLVNDASHAVDSGVLATKVMAKLASVDAGAALFTSASASGGTVTLHGKARTPEIAARFVAAAKSVDGVTAVTNELRIDPHTPRIGRDAHDFGVTAAVRANLVGQAGVNGVNVGVRAANGVVTLSGTVKSAALRTTLVDAARGTQGVRSVVDRLTVGS